MMNLKRTIAVALSLVLLGAPLRAQQVPHLTSRGPVLNPATGQVLAAITNIAAGLHTFRVIASASGTTAVVVEWRAKNGALRWQQGLMVPSTGSLVVPIAEEQPFEEGDTLQIVVYANAQGTVWASLSLK